MPPSYRHPISDDPKRVSSLQERRRARIQAQSARLLDNYGLVLIMLVASFMLITAGNNAVSRVALVITLAGGVLATYRASSVTARTVTTTRVLVVGAAIIAITAVIAEDRLIAPWVLAPLSVLIVSAPGVIVQRILGHRTVTAQTILGAICAYVYIGLIFALVYGLVDAVGSEPFFAQGPVDRPGQYTYFSFVTMTTLGYGDLSPGTDLGEGLVVLEALLGSIYMVTLVARLVSMYGRGREPSTEDRPSA